MGRSAVFVFVLGALLVGGCVPSTPSTLTTPMLEVPEKGERWLCGDRYPSGGPVTVVLTRETPVAVRLGHGQVSVAGVVSEALFAVNGVERRWDWDKSAMVLQPDGDALFYDFRSADDEGRAKPSGFFACRRG